MENTSGAFAYHLGSRGPHQQLRIEFTLLKTKLKKPSPFVVLKLPFGDASIDSRNLPRINHCATEADLKALFEGYCQAIKRGDSALIAVQAAGKGPTPASSKIKVAARWPDPEHGSDATKLQEHTITVPVSQLEQRADGLYAPRWLIRQTLYTRLKFRPASVPGGQWFGAQQLWDEVFAPAWAAVELETERLARDAQEMARLEAVRNEAAAEREAHFREQEAAHAAAAAKLAAQRAKYLESLETLENVTVVWSERRTSSTRNEQWLERREGCTVRFSGSRVYITPPKGGRVVKTRNTVQINDEELSPGHAIRKFLEREAKGL